MYFSSKQSADGVLRPSLSLNSLLFGSVGGMGTKPTHELVEKLNALNYCAPSPALISRRNNSSYDWKLNPAHRKRAEASIGQIIIISELVRRGDL